MYADRWQSHLGSRACGLVWPRRCVRAFAGPERRPAGLTPRRGRSPAPGDRARTYRGSASAGQGKPDGCRQGAGYQPAGALPAPRSPSDCRRGSALASGATQAAPVMDERLTRSERFESIGRLAGGIAHDFNNLLTAILGYTDLLLSDRAESDPDRADLEEIQKAGRRAAALTQQLLAFSRRQVLMPEDVDLGQTLTTLRETLTRLVREDISVVYEVPATPAVVHVDPAQLEQVLVNLVLNARDGLAPSGRIGIGVAHVKRSEIEPPPDTPVTAGEYVRLRVSDDGVAIPLEAQAHLFEPFFAAKELGRGTGLGLASVYGIVRQSGGFISVDSQHGVGTTVTVYFPEAAAVSGDPAGPRETADPVVGDETILLV